MYSVALPGDPHLRAIRDVTCHMGSHSVTCHPTQVNAMQAGRPYSIPTRDGWKAELIVIVIAPTISNAP